MQFTAYSVAVFFAGADPPIWRGAPPTHPGWERGSWRFYRERPGPDPVPRAGVFGGPDPSLEPQFWTWALPPWCRPPPVWEHESAAFPGNLISL